MKGDFIASNNFVFAAMPWIYDDTQRNMQGTHSIDEASELQPKIHKQNLQRAQIWNLCDIFKVRKGAERNKRQQKR